MTLLTACRLLREARVMARDLDRRDPKKFYVVIPFSDDYAKKKLVDLSHGVLDSVQGISEKSEIIMQWYGMARDAVLVMDGKELAKLNQLSRLQYDNPEYLVSRGMAALHRIWDKKMGEDGAYGVAGNLVGALISASALKSLRGQKILDEASALAGQIDAAADKLQSALAALSFDGDERRAIESVTDRQLDEDNFSYFIKESKKVAEDLRSVAGWYEGLSKRTVNLYMDERIAVHDSYRDAAALAPRAVANALDYGWTADQAGALRDLMAAFAALVDERLKVEGLKKRALAELDLLSQVGDVRYALNRGSYRQELQKDFRDQGTDDIKTVKGLAKRLHQVAKRVHDTEDIPLTIWEVLTRRALKTVGHTYADEGEWLVKDRKLKIPKKSALYVTASPLPPDLEKKRKAGTLTDLEGFVHRSHIEKADQLDRLIEEYKLDDRYRIFRLSPEKMEKAKKVYRERPRPSMAIDAAFAIPLRDPRRSLLLMQNAAQVLAKSAAAWPPALEAEAPMPSSLRSRAEALADWLGRVVAELQKKTRATSGSGPAAVMMKGALRELLPDYRLDALRSQIRDLLLSLQPLQRDVKDIDADYMVSKGHISEIEANFIRGFIEKLPLIIERLDFDRFKKQLKDLLKHDDSVPTGVEKEETLYHASVNAVGIAKTGFAAKPPRDGGLGGSQSDKAGNPAISFTYDLHAAKEIARSLKEAVEIARGQYTRAKLLRLIEDEDADALRRALNEADDKGQDEPAWLFVIYSYFVSYANKRFDPRYFGNRKRMAETFAKADPRKVGVVEAGVNTAHPDVLHLSGERELRVPPAAVLRIVRVIR